MTLPTESLSETTRQAIDVLTRETGVARTLQFLAQYRTGTGDYTADRDAFLPEVPLDDLLEEAKRLDTEAASLQATIPESHQDLALLGLAANKLHLGQLLQDMKRFGEAEAALREALAIYERLVGPNHPDAVSAREHLSALRPE